ncbi:MAG: ion transporter [Stackebrandtia sp.]
MPAPNAVLGGSVDLRAHDSAAAKPGTSGQASTPEPPDANRLTAALYRLSESRAFQMLATGVIIANAVLIGAETYDVLLDSYGAVFAVLDVVFLTFFIGELAVRVGAFGRRPWNFFKNGWNVFDFVVVAAALVPGLRENVTLLRLLRLARIVRILRMFPALRILLTAVWRSLPGAVGLVGIAGVLLYLYGMVGWILFGEALPDQYGSIGSAVLTLFMLLTFDEVANTVRAGMEVTSWAVPFYVSFVLFGGFVLINLLIGVVITSMEEAHSIERGESSDPEETPPESRNDVAEILARLDALQRAVAELSAERSGGDGRQPPDSEPAAPPEN